MTRQHFYQSRKPAPRLPSIIRHSKADELKLKLIPHQHLQAIIDGRGGKPEFASIAFRVVVGAALTEFADNRGPLDEVFKAAIDSLILVGERYQRLATFGTSGDELQTLKAALNLADDLQEVCTRRQQAEMYTTVRQFIGSFDLTMRNLQGVRKNYGERDVAV
ncbi:hypothetical protein AWB81_07383 [Caballeronia arationis]|nr:hypothetical protein AWB81_07383 [Caballeronia arationis]